MTPPEPTAPDDDRDDDDTSAAIGPAEDGMAPLVSNTGEDPSAGDDADAASG